MRRGSLTYMLCLPPCPLQLQTECGAQELPHRPPPAAHRHAAAGQPRRRGVRFGPLGGIDVHHRDRSVPLHLQSLHHDGGGDRKLPVIDHRAGLISDPDSTKYPNRRLPCRTTCRSCGACSTSCCPTCSARGRTSRPGAPAGGQGGLCTRGHSLSWGTTAVDEYKQGLHRNMAITLPMLPL